MDQLRTEGWHINETQTSELFDEGVLPKTHQEIQKTILNEDLRHFGEASIINLTKKEASLFQGPCVLQLLRYRNVSVPRIKEELNQADPAHSIIRLFFTDGHTSISALVLQTIPGISSETPPGTKIQINGTVPIEGNFLILDKKNVKILGGRVEEMIEKWNVEKSSVRADGFKSSVGKGTGAPKWVSFGKRGQEGHLEKGFKANSVMPKTQKEDDADDDFSKNRAEMLKELQEDNTTKTFSKPNLAPPPVKAPAPPKERVDKPATVRPPRKGRGRKNSEDGPDVDVGEYAYHKPSGPATLFDFIGGGEKGAELVAAVTEKTAKMGVLETQGNRGAGTSGAVGDRRHGDRDPRPPRNDTRGGGHKTFDDRNQGPKRDQGKKPDQPRGDRPTTGPSSQNRPDHQNQGRQNRPNTGPPNAHGAQNFRQNQGSNPRGNQGPPQNPRGQQSFQQNQDSNPRHHQNQGQNFHQGPPRSNQGFQQNPDSNPRGHQNQGQNFNQGRGNQGYQQNQGSNPRGNQGPPQNPRGQQNFQQNQDSNPRHHQTPGQNFHQGRGNQGFQQNQDSNPRGNQGFQQNQGPPRSNFHQGPPPSNPRGNNQNFQQNQGQNPRGNQNFQAQSFNQGPPQNPRGSQGGPQNFQAPPPSNPRGNQHFQQNQGYQGNRGQGPSRGNFNQGPQRGAPGVNAQAKVGAQCLATWSDGNLYPATITEILPNRTAVVRYNEYGNVNTIPVDFLIFS